MGINLRRAQLDLCDIRASHGKGGIADAEIILPMVDELIAMAERRLDIVKPPRIGPVSDLAFNGIGQLLLV